MPSRDCGTIPFFVPTPIADLTETLSDALSGGVVPADGPICTEVEQVLAEVIGARHVLLVKTCSQALEVALRVLGIGPGDEVILPSFAYVSVGNAVVLAGARPIFAEVRDQDLTLDPADVQARLSPCTRAVICIHYGGHPCDMDALQAICAEHGVALIEDAAHALGARIGDRAVGSIGRLGCFSFHVTKSIHCLDGGAIATDDDELAGRVRTDRDRGTDRHAFLRGEIDHYSWRAPGSSLLLSDWNAAILRDQLHSLGPLLDRHRLVAARYDDRFRSLVQQGLLRTLRSSPGTCSSQHVYGLILSDPSSRPSLIDRMASDGIECRFHFVPLHSSPFAREQLGWTEPLPRTDRLASGLVRLPIYHQLTDASVDRVANAVVRAVTQLME